MLKPKLTEDDIADIVNDEAESFDTEVACDLWTGICGKIKKAEPDMRRADLIVETARQMYLLGFRLGLQTLNASLEDGDGRKEA